MGREKFSVEGKGKKRIRDLDRNREKGYLEAIGPKG